WSLAIPVATLETRGVTSSLARSWRLTRGRRGSILLIYFLFVVLSYVLASLWQIPVMIGVGVLSLSARQASPALPAWAQIATIVGSFLTHSLVGPLLTIALALVYYDQRVRKEAFDLEHLMDGLQGGGNPR